MFTTPIGHSLKHRDRAKETRHRKGRTLRLRLASADVHPAWCLPSNSFAIHTPKDTTECPLTFMQKNWLDSPEVPNPRTASLKHAGVHQTYPCLTG
jgi:hypothetical protein